MPMTVMTNPMETGAQRLIQGVLAAGAKTLTEPESKGLLSAYAIPVPRFKVVQNVESALDAARELHYPLALKIVSRDISHKTGVGGVALGLRGRKDLEDAWSQMMLDIADDEPLAALDGFLIEEMAPAGVEVIIGGLRDPQFGPAVMFGTGGISVELIKDVSYRLAPVTRSEAFDMMNETKGFPLLTGWRGGGMRDLDAVAGVIMKVSEIITGVPGIKEIEINPLIVYPNGAVAVDARAVLE